MKLFVLIPLLLFAFPSFSQEAFKCERRAELGFNDCTVDFQNHIGTLYCQAETSKYVLYASTDIRKQASGEYNASYAATVIVHESKTTGKIMQVGSERDIALKPFESKAKATKGQEQIRLEPRFRFLTDPGRMDWPVTVTMDFFVKNTSSITEIIKDPYGDFIYESFSMKARFGESGKTVDMTCTNTYSHFDLEKDKRRYRRIIPGDADLLNFN